MRSGVIEVGTAELERLKKIDAEEVPRLRGEIAALRKEVERLKGSVDEEGQARESKGYWRGILNTILLSVAVIVLLFIAVFVRRPAPQAPASVDSNTCPRCGWALAPGSTKCGNPDCRTRLR